jgi:hypothetical protein
VDLYQSPQARTALERVFGMGVMAPGDWATQTTFPYQPRQNNVVDAIAERHQCGAGLVDAFKVCGRCGTKECVGRLRQAAARLGFVDEIHRRDLPKHLGSSGQIGKHRGTFALRGAVTLTRNSGPQHLKTLEQRREIVEVQIKLFERETSISPEAAKNVWKFALTETWA